MDEDQNINWVQRWMTAIRPKTLTAALSPVIVGWGLAVDAGGFSWASALAAMIGALMIQIGTNLVNDVVDFKKGADQEDRLGPTRVTLSGLLTAKQVWMGVYVSFGVAVLAGIYLTFAAGMLVVVIGTVSILAGLAYTAGPYPLAYSGLGDLFVLIFFGFVAVCGTVFVISGFVPGAAWLAAAGVGALTTNILVINNIRDVESDRRAGRKNIPVNFGRRAAEWEFGLMLILAFGALVLLISLKFSDYWMVMPFFTLPKGLGIWKKLRGGLSGASLNPVLGETAQMLFRYSLLLSLAFLIPKIF